MTKTQNKIAPEDFTETASLKHWGEPPRSENKCYVASETIVDCGWGRLIFGQTFDRPERLAEALQEETKGRRDVALYARDPNVVLSYAPQALFLDPSYTFRLDLTARPEAPTLCSGFVVRVATVQDEAAINAIYKAQNMVPFADEYLSPTNKITGVKLLVAEDQRTSTILGAVMGVDHVEAFNDPDDGSSLWALAVDPQAQTPGIGEALVLALADQFQASGLVFMDLSVMHDNEQAKALYDKLGFEQVPVYCVKKKNPINEPLFVGPTPEKDLNIYTKIIIDEARRRGIAVIIEDVDSGLFTLSFGGRSISCRESLSDLTSAVAMSRCDDKSLTYRLLKGAGLKVPEQIIVDSGFAANAFLDKHQRVVVKPSQGEQGRGVFVDLRRRKTVEHAIERAREICGSVVIEEYVPGEDLRVIVIDGEVVAAAVRRPARVTGDGKHTVTELIQKQSRRRSAATGGESHIPVDGETKRCVRRAGYDLGDIVSEGETLTVRNTANLHTGGTINDVTPRLHPALAKAAARAAKILQIPVVGLDFIVPSVTGSDYHIIEANERAGLANHEPAPTAERFIDFLFPQTKEEVGRSSDVGP